MKPYYVAAGVWGVAAAALALTIAPSVHTYYFDSPEFVIGAHTLGVVHAPGYPLYLMLAHLFTYLPVGDVAFRVNLFSAVSLSLVAPLLYLTLHTLIGNRTLAAGTTLATLFTYHIWQTGVSAEVYAPQLLTLALTGWLLARLHQQRGRHTVYWLGVSYGLALAMNPASVLFLPALVVALVLLRVRVQTSLLAGAIALVIAALPLVYFPVRAGAPLAYAAAGTYDSVGNFQAVNLRTIEGVWWLVSGAQFAGLFHWLPTWEGIQLVLLTLAGNVLWVGAIVALIGWLALWQERKGVLAVWWVAWLPFVYFYSAYGATDKITMLGAAHLLLSVPMAFGLRALLHDLPHRATLAVMLIAVGGVLIVNFITIRGERDAHTRDEAAFILENLPADALVFGRWGQVMPLQYLHIVEDLRPDITLYNLFFFKDEPFTKFMQYTAWEQPRPLVLLQITGNSASQNTLVQHFLELEPIIIEERIIGYRVLGYRDAF